MTKEERAIQILNQRACCMECVVTGFTCSECDEAFDMAIKALEQKPSISDDGTLTVNVEDGSKVSRVLVCGDNHFGGLYYPDQEPKIGHWIRITDKTGHLVWECDKCEWQQRYNTNFCPDCGAKMESEENG